MLNKLVSLAVGSPRAAQLAAADAPVTWDTIGTARLRDVIGRMPGDTAAAVTREIALTIPAVTRAMGHFVGRTSTFRLETWKSGAQVTDHPAARWLSQPDLWQPLSWTLAATMDDLVWFGRSVWEVRGRFVTGEPSDARRVHPQRVSWLTDPHDPDRVISFMVDGRGPFNLGDRTYLLFDAGPLGGRNRYAAPLLSMGLQLLDAARRYAATPNPSGILTNKSQHELSDDEIQELLTDWAEARQRHAVAYLNQSIEFASTPGYSARELQLIEAREHISLEVARLFGLPAASLDATATSGASLTYENRVDARQEIVAALEPLMNVITSTLSMRGPRAVLPQGMTAKFNADDYLRDPAETTARTLTNYVAAGVLTPEQARQADPRIRSLPE